MFFYRVIYKLIITWALFIASSFLFSYYYFGCIKHGYINAPYEVLAVGIAEFHSAILIRMLPLTVCIRFVIV